MSVLGWIGDKIESGVDAVGEVASDAVDYGSEVVSDVVETGGEVLDAGGEVVNDVVDYGGEVVSDVVDYGGGVVNDAIDYGGGVIDDLSSAASQPFAGMYDGGVDPTMAAASSGGGGGIFEHYVLPGLHVVEGLAKHGGPAANFLGKALPPLAAGFAAYHYQEGGKSQGNEKWDHYGSAALNAASMVPGLGAEIGAVELGWNGIQSLAGWGLHDDSHFYSNRGGNMNQVLGYTMSRFAHDDEATSLIERTRERDRLEAEGLAEGH